MSAASGGRRAQLMNGMTNRSAVRGADFRRLGRGDLEKVGKVIQLDLAAHPAKFSCHRSCVVSDLRPVFHDSPPRLLDRCLRPLTIGALERTVSMAAAMREVSEAVHTGSGFFTC